MGVIRHALLNARDIHQDLRELPQTLTSWDKCMEKSFCKWPVIAGCIIAGIIVISCIWCLIRCCMCGVACCSCCCGGCGGSKTKTKRIEYVSAPPIYTQPAFQPPPAYENQKSGVTHSQREMPRAYQNQPREQPREAPQYAYEDQGTVSDNALPSMPTWETMKVEVVKEEVEMSHVNNEPHRQRNSPGPGPGGYAAPSGQPLPRGTSPGPSLMSAPIPVNPAGQKLGFNPRGQTPAPRGQTPAPTAHYDERGVDEYGYPLSQNPMPGQQPRQKEFDASYPYDQGHATVPNPAYFQDERDYPGQAGYGAPQNKGYANDQYHTGYPQDQNVSYPLDTHNTEYGHEAPNTRYRHEQHNTGYGHEQHNAGYGNEQHNTGYGHGQQNYNRPQSLDYPADLTAAPAQTNYPAQNQQAELGLPTRSLTSPTNGGYAAYNAPQEPSGYTAFPGASSSPSPKPVQGSGYGNSPTPSNSNGGYQAYAPSQQQQQHAPYPDEDNFHGAYDDDKRRKQQEWSAL